MLALTTLLFASSALATPHLNKRGWNDWTASEPSSTSGPSSTTTRSVSSSTTNTTGTASLTHWADWESSSSIKSSVSSSKSAASGYSSYKSSPATTNLVDYPVPSGYVLVKGDGACDGGSGSSSGSSSSGNYGTYNSGSSSSSSSSGSGSGSNSGSGYSGSGSSILDKTFYSAPVTTLLKPAVHWDMDMFSMDRVKPASPDQGSTLFFSEDKHPSQPKLSAFANYNFTGPSVAIDQSAYLGAAADGKGNMVVRFSTKTAYNAAASTWSGTSGMFLVGYIPNCGNYEGHELCYFKVTSLTFDSTALACHATGIDTKLQEAITHWEFRWDFYQPGKASKPWDAPSSDSGFGSGSGPGSGSNATNSGTAFPTLNTTLSNSNTTTNGTNATTTCVAPIDTKYGLPTACLGYTFDQILDDNFGAEDWNENGWYDEMVGFGPQITMDDDIDVVPGSPAAIDKRGALDFLKKAADKAAMKKDEAVKWAKDKARQIPIKGVTQPIDGSTKPYNFNLRYPKAGKVQYEEHKVWKNAIKLFDKQPDEKTLLNLAKKDKETVYKGKKVKVERSLKADMHVKGYCVDCSFTGSVITVGHAKGSLLDGFTAAALDVTADMTAVVQLGVEAEFELTLAKFSVKLGEVGVEGLLAIPGAISVGPYADIAVEVVPKLTLAGTLFAGAQITWKQAKARLSWGNSEQSGGSGWTPEFKPVFNATGEIGAAIDVGLPIGINLGISILNGKFERKFAVEERPSIEAKASIGGSLSLEKQEDGKKKIEAKAGTEECMGIKASISFKNELSCLYTDPVKGDKKPLWKPKALEYEKPLWEGCWKLFGNATEKADDKKTTRRAIHPHQPRHLFRRQELEEDADLAFIPLEDANNATDLLPSNWTLTDDNVISVLSNTTNTTKYTGDGVIAPFPINPYNTSDGFQYTQLVSEDFSYMLASCSDGNVFAQEYSNTTTLGQVGCGALWTYEINVTDAAVMADGSGRVMHYYPSTMDKVGVSRLRLSDMQSIPKDSAYISFIELENPDDGTYNYWPVDLENDITFGLAVCSYKDQPAKAFLVEDPSTGLDLLQSPDLKYSVTGGDITACYSFFMRSSVEKALEWWSGVGGNLDFADEWVEDYEYDDNWDWLDGPEDDPEIDGITSEIEETTNVGEGERKGAGR